MIKSKKNTALSLFISILLVICSMTSMYGNVMAEDNTDFTQTVYWTSNSYSIISADGEIQFSGATKYSYSCSTKLKLDLTSYSTDIKLDYDFQNSSFDWYAVVFGPLSKPFITSSGAVSLLFRIRGTEVIVSIINSNLVELVQITVPRDDEDKHSLTVNATENEFSAEVDGVKISTNDDSINYRLLSRGAYNGFAVNGGTGYEDKSFKLALSNMNFKVFDSSNVEIVYGSTITIDDERIKALLSNNFSIVTENNSSGLQYLWVYLSIGVIAVIVITIMIFVIKNKKFGGKRK